LGGTSKEGMPSEWCFLGKTKVGGTGEKRELALPLKPHHKLNGKKQSQQGVVDEHPF